MNHDAAISLQELLMNVNDSNIEATSDAILSSFYVKSQQSVSFLVHNFFIAAYCRPMAMMPLAKLLYSVFSGGNEANCCKFILTAISFENNNAHHLPYYFYFCLMKAGFPQKIILYSVVTLLERSAEKFLYNKQLGDFKDNRIFYGYALFAPELIATNNFEWFQLQIEYYKKDYGIEIYPNVETFFEIFDELKANNWEKYNKQRDYGWTPNEIYMAIQSDDEVKLEQLSHNPNFDVNAPIPWSAFERCEFLQNEPKPVHIAAFFNSPKCLSFLVANGADLHATDSAGRTIIQFAIAGGNEDTRILDREKVSYDGAIHIAARFHRYHQFDSLRAMKGCDLTKDVKGLGTILHQASISNNVKILSFFGNFANQNDTKNSLQLDFNVKANDLRNSTPLILAIKNFNFEATEYLLSLQQVDVNATDKLGKAPLHHACKRGYTDYIKILFKKSSINPNPLDQYHQTPVYFAAAGGYFQTLKELLNHNGVDVNIRDRMGMTPRQSYLDMSMAASIHVCYGDIIRLLKKHERR
ncbi:hypothetical protein TRFO_03261 [Tritrichomonas foetus]|uniref:Uncharacterized protein n=1 Tax=Tritrichomonas foetus TaxID=1144522 RepID=A0A1J4KQK9_9EUKA|nr:hypothetical protein TRFO_03261 [Tritrichomonas foetus]|eukprot:OHT13531.1 hypothetical protein TRFO_03261 [Tritrichomonas foetus]